MHAIVIVRYSVFTLTSAHSWTLGSRHEAAVYREKLFDPARLDAHEFLFKKLTLPSLLHQTKAPSAAWFRLVVATSPLLPESYRRRLDLLLAPHDWAQVIEVAPDEPLRLCEAVPGIVSGFAHRAVKPLVYATTRLDDDDALSQRFFANLERYVRPEFEGFAVSFANGYSAVFDVTKSKLDPCFAEYAPKLALGLSMVHVYDSKSGEFRGPIKCIYAAGNHESIDRRAPVIVDAAEPSFLRSLHEHSDSYAARQRKRETRPVVSPEVLRRHFHLGAELI